MTVIVNSGQNLLILSKNDDETDIILARAGTASK